MNVLSDVVTSRSTCAHTCSVSKMKNDRDLVIYTRSDANSNIVRISFLYKSTWRGTRLMQVKRPKVIQFINVWSKVCCPHTVPLNRILIRLVKILIVKNLSGVYVFQRRKTEKEEWKHLKDTTPTDISCPESEIQIF